MKLLEALIQVRDKDAIVINNNDFKIKKSEYNYLVYHPELHEWICWPLLIEQLDFEDGWEIYEEPEKKGLCIASILIHCDSTGVSIGSDLIRIPAFNEKTAHEWQKALATFFELKSHPLVGKIKPSSPYYFLHFFKERFVVDYGCSDCDGNFFITNLIVFSKWEDHKKILEDIGEERLIHMFRTFQGIYE